MLVERPVVLIQTVDSVGCGIIHRNIFCEKTCHCWAENDIVQFFKHHKPNSIHHHWQIKAKPKVCARLRERVKYLMSNECDLTDVHRRVHSPYIIINSVSLYVTVMLKYYCMLLRRGAIGAFQKRLCFHVNECKYKLRSLYLTPEKAGIHRSHHGCQCGIDDGTVNLPDCLCFRAECRSRGEHLRVLLKEVTEGRCLQVAP